MFLRFRGDRKSMRKSLARHVENMFPKLIQNSSKIGPRAAPKAAQERPKSVLRAIQERPKSGARAIQRQVQFWGLASAVLHHFNLSELLSGSGKPVRKQNS